MLDNYWSYQVVQENNGEKHGLIRYCKISNISETFASGVNITSGLDKKKYKGLHN